MTDSILSASQAAPKYGLPQSEGGFAWGKQTAPVNTSNINLLNSKQQAMFYGNAKGPGINPNPSYVGKGAIYSGTEDTPAPINFRQ
jgi:hypothetical protein